MAGKELPVPPAAFAARARILKLPTPCTTRAQHALNYWYSGRRFLHPRYERFRPPGSLAWAAEVLRFGLPAPAALPSARHPSSRQR